MSPERAGCGRAARAVRRAATGNGAKAWTEAPAWGESRRQQRLSTDLTPPRQSSTLPRKRAAGPPHGQADGTPVLPGDPHRSRGRASGGGVGGSGVSLLSAPCGQDARAPRTSLPGPWLGRGSGWLGGVAPISALRAFGPLRARCPRSQGTPSLPGGRASGGGVGGSGVSLLSALCGPSARCGQDARAPRTSLPGGRASGGGVGGSGVSLLSALCGPSARCGQDARAPRTSLPGPCLGRGCGWLGGVAPVGALRARCPRSQDIAPGAVPRAGEWVARGCRSCRRLAGKMPALPGHRSRGRASGGGVDGSGVSLLSAPCGPSARCGQDARAPRTSLPEPCLGWGSGTCLIDFALIVNAIKLI